MLPGKQLSIAESAKDAVLGLSLGVVLAIFCRLLARSISALNLQVPRWVHTLWVLNRVAAVWWLAAAALLLIAGGLAYGNSLHHFATKCFNSWRVGIVSGVAEVWFVIGILVLRISRTHRTSAGVLFAFGIVYVIARLVRSAPVCEENALDIPLVPRDRPELDNLPGERAVDYDLPIINWDDDRIGRGPFILSIAKEILDRHAPVIAIDGPFGEGKTSALNLLADSLAGRKDVIVVRFNSWLPGDELSLAVTLFSTLADQIRERYFIPRFGSELQKYARLLAGAVPTVGDSLKDLFSPPSQEQQLGAIKEVLNRCPVRIAVLIDEVDRMDAKEIRLLLKILRGVADLPNISFVCAVNHQALIQILSPGNPIYGRLFLEKFFPLRRRLPPTDLGLLSRMFDRQFDAICKEFQLLQEPKEQTAFNERFRPLWQSNLKFWMSNLRRLSLFFNGLHSAIAPVHREVNFYDILILQVIKQMSDEAYEFILTNGPLFYFPEWRIWNWLENQSSLPEENDRRRTARIVNFLESLDKDIRAQITPLLEDIFPTVERIDGLVPWARKVPQGAVAFITLIFSPDTSSIKFLTEYMV